MTTVEERRSLISGFVDDPPLVHAGGHECYRTFPELYELLAWYAPPDSETFETGLGISTALFAAWGTNHTCACIDQGEVNTLLKYLKERDIATDRLNFLVGPTYVTLPDFEPPWPLDVVFIDGSHGFPHAVIDYYYATRWLKIGGALVMDDMQIPAISQTIGWYTRLDPRWTHLFRDQRWAAYEKNAEPAPNEEFWDQMFLGDPFKGRPNR